MTLQLRILLGIVAWLAGVVLDILLFPFAFILIYGGIIFTCFEVIKWLRVIDNRIRAKEVLGFGIKRDFLALIRTAFDFSWRRISVLWTMCAVFGMVILLLGNMIKFSDPYKVAIESIQTDDEIAERTGEIVQFTSMISGNVSNHQSSKLHIGVIGQKESFWVTVYVDPTEDGYKMNYLVIHE